MPFFKPPPPPHPTHNKHTHTPARQLSPPVTPLGPANHSPNSWHTTLRYSLPSLSFLDMPSTAVPIAACTCTSSATEAVRTAQQSPSVATQVWRFKLSFKPQLDADPSRLIQAQGQCWASPGPSQRLLPTYLWQHQGATRSSGGRSFHMHHLCCLIHVAGVGRRGSDGTVRTVTVVGCSAGGGWRGVVGQSACGAVQGGARVRGWWGYL